MILKSFTLIACITISPFLHSETLVKSVDLQADRFMYATIVAKLPLGADVKVLKTEAGWMQVTTGTATGWVRANALSGTGAKTTTAAHDNGRMAGNNRLSTSGIRGVFPVSSQDPITDTVQSTQITPSIPPRSSTQ